jgi:Replication-relaxation
VAVSGHLQPRDYLLARLLAQHQTLTTAQITAVAFSSATTAAHRLRLLRRIGFIDRFTHHRPGRPALTCWVPGLLSARYTALAAGQNPPTPRAVRHRQDQTLANPQLDHLLGVNQFFTDLIAHTRTDPGTRLIRWWSAERTAAAFAGRIHPDGHGLWQTPRTTSAASDDRLDPEPDADAEAGTVTVGFWLEHDTGSEPLGRLVAKLGPYARLQQAGGPRYPILFWLPSDRRQANLHQLLHATPPPDGVIVATGVHAHTTPAGPGWRLVTPPGRDHAPAGNDSARLRLGDLPHSAAAEGPLNPRPTADDDPLHT